MPRSLDCFHEPRSIAVVGASDDAEKIGGRPLRYLRENHYAGWVIPVNRRREEVQGIATVPLLSASWEVPDVALIAVPGRAAVDAVSTAADLGVKGCVVMSSGFGETGTEEGVALQEEMFSHAARGGMRLVGPNSQGLASFHSGAVLSFSTLFTEEPPSDGPVAVVSQSGALCSVCYGALRRRGIGVRYAHSTGNDADVTAAELAAEVVRDEHVRLLMLYLENVQDRDSLLELAEASRARNVPVLALVGGRSQRGSRAAASHTGALATERRVLDAFLERIGIWQVHSVQEMVAATQLYLQGWQPRGERLAVLSNSGAAGVLAADAAEAVSVPLAEFQGETVDALRSELPAFATVSNPVDVTAALLTDSSIFGRVLPVIGRDESVDACLLAIAVAGRGYDVERFAADAAAFSDEGIPLVLAIPQPNVAKPFVDAGLPVFEDETSAVKALGQYLAHRNRMVRADRLLRPSSRRRTEAVRQLDECDSLTALDKLGMPVVAHEWVRSPAEAAEAFARLGGERAVLKGLSSTTSHKSELGLVELGLGSAAEMRAAAERVAQAAYEHAVSLDGFLVAPMVPGLHEVLVGGHIDSVFGPVMVLGAGGLHVEAVPDTQLLLAPCSPGEVREAIGRLRMAPLLAGVRGKPPADIEAWVSAVVAASQALADPDCPVCGFDANPVMLHAEGEGALAVDAVVLTA